MKRIPCLVLLMVIVLGTVGFSQISVTPRSVGVLLFDNSTGTTISKLALIFDKPAKLGTSDILVIGGEIATLVALSNNYAFIDVVVVPGGTLQITLSGEGADAKVTSAFWFN